MTTSGGGVSRDTSGLNFSPSLISTFLCVVLCIFFCVPAASWAQQPFATPSGPGESSAVFWTWVRCTCSVLPPSSCCSVSPVHTCPPPPLPPLAVLNFVRLSPYEDVCARDQCIAAPLRRWQVWPLKAGPCLTSLPAILKGLLEGAVTTTHSPR